MWCGIRMAPIQFTLRDVLLVVAKASLLMPAVGFVTTPIESCGVLTAVTVLISAELMIASRSSRVPTVFRAIFFISRLCFGYAILLSIDLVLLARHIPRQPSLSLRDAIGTAFGTFIFAGLLLTLSLLASAISCVTALVAWRKDRRARWLAYLNGACLIAAAVFLLLAQ